MFSTYLFRPLESPGVNPISIMNGHNAPSLKEAFQFNNERHKTYNLRNRDSDLAPPMPKLIIMVPCIGIIFPMRQKLLNP
jgi:hypothetical protein